MSWSGGCQCGAVRYRAGRLGRASICHCRMCQKAMGGFFGPFVDAHDLEWTRGEPSRFQSSDTVWRGFCPACGTPLFYEAQGWPLNLAIGTFDDPAEIVPTLQVGEESKLPYADHLAGLARRSTAEAAKVEDFYAKVVSRQHPDHDTETWPPSP